jgi:uracil phosphoribosyltransferase
MSLRVVDHPLAQHYLTRLRDRTTEPHQFRQCGKALATMLILEATRNMGLRGCPIDTPLESMIGRELAHSLVAIPILRAGLLMLDPVLDLFPHVSIGTIGLERDHVSAIANRYHAKLPDLKGGFVLVLDPMLATGGTASQAVSLVKAGHPARVILVSVVAAPEGVARMTQDHPDVEIITAGADRGLSDLKYILPGLGDYGDRLFGT